MPTVVQPDMYRGCSVHPASWAAWMALEAERGGMVVAASLGNKLLNATIFYMKVG